MRRGLHAAAARAAREEDEATQAIDAVAASVRAFEAETPGTKSDARTLYIQRKVHARALLQSLPPSSAAAATERLALLQLDFRTADAARTLASRALLLPSSGSERKVVPIQPTSNDNQLTNAARTGAISSARLVDAAREVEMTLVVARATAEHVEGDRGRIEKVSENLDELQGELERTRILVLRFMKRLVTDGIFIALCSLVSLLLVGLAIWIGLNPEGFVRLLKPPP